MHVIIYQFAEVIGRRSLRQRARDWRENVAPMKSRAQRWAIIFFIRQLIDERRGFVFTDVAEEAVIGADEEMLAGRDEERAAGGADAGVNYREVDCLRRKIFIGSEQRERACLYIVRGNLVGDVNDLRQWIDRQDRTLHRTNEIVGRAEIGQESNDHSVCFKSQIPSP